MSNTSYLSLTTISSCLEALRHSFSLLHCKKRLAIFPSPAEYSRPGRVWLVTSRLGTEKSPSYSVLTGPTTRHVSLHPSRVFPLMSFPSDPWDLNSRHHVVRNFVFLSYLIDASVLTSVFGSFVLMSSNTLPSFSLQQDRHVQFMDLSLHVYHEGIWRTMHCRLCINCYGTCWGGGVEAPFPRRCWRS